MTFSIKTHNIMTVSITAFTIMTLNIKKFRIMPLSMRTVSTMRFTIVIILAKMTSNSAKIIML